MDANAQLVAIFQRLQTDFEYWLGFIKLRSRDWKVRPEESTIAERPIALAAHQKQLINYINTTAEGTVLKSRQIGVTTVLLLYSLWEVLYHPSRNVLFVIDGEKKSRELVGECREIYESIPELIRPKANIFASGKLECSITGSKLHLATATMRTGRSETYTRVILDEFAFYSKEIQLAVDTAVVASCPVGRVVVSTPAAENDMFHKKCIMAEKDGNLFKKDIWNVAEDWYGSKENAEAWFNVSTKGKTKSQVNREYLCKFRGAVENTVIAIEQGMIAPAYHTKNHPVIFSMDLGWVDDTCVLFAHINPEGGLHIFDELIVSGTKIIDICDQIKRKGYRIIYGICDSSGKKRDLTSGHSAWGEMRELLGVNILTGKAQKMDMLYLLQSALFRGTLKICPSCERTVEMMHNYGWKNDKEGSFEHDDRSHIFDAMSYLIYNYIAHGGRKRSGCSIRGNLLF